MARLRSSRRRRRQRPPRRTARTAETANKADSIEPGRPNRHSGEPAGKRSRDCHLADGHGRLPDGSARQRIRRAKREKTYSVSRAGASTGAFDVTRALVRGQRADTGESLRTGKPRWPKVHPCSPSSPIAAAVIGVGDRHAERRVRDQPPVTPVMKSPLRSEMRSPSVSRAPARSY